MADLFLFIRVSMEGGMMEAEGVDLKGQIRDHFTIEEGKGGIRWG